MIAVYPLRPGDDNPELKHSLRSLAHCPQIDHVVTVGHRPAWLRPDEHIDGNHHDSGHRNVFDNIRLACHWLAGEDHVAIWNDDMYATKHVAELPVWYRGTLDEHLNLPRVKRAAGQWWPTSLETTRLCLQAHGVTSPISYELHIPFLCSPRKMADTLDMLQHVTPDNPPQWRSMYGNLHHIGGQQHTDGKAYRAGPINRPWHSTEDSSYPHFEQQLADLFPEPSRWER